MRATKPRVTKLLYGFRSASTWICIVIGLSTLLYVTIPEALSASQIDNHSISIFINRNTKTLFIINDGVAVDKMPCGIGRGGLKTKTSMLDSVTPTGQFEVDIILSKRKNQNSSSDAIRRRYKDTPFTEYVTSGAGMERLFNNMNAIDFNKDGKPDDAYGAAYIGLDSDESITGPKMKYYNGMPYWFSIAIHGTNDEANIGKANSGGCIHLRKDDLERILNAGFAKIGTKVTISDSDPDIH